MPSPPTETERRRCPKCGGELKLKVLNYWRETTTDRFAAGDTQWVCVRCNSTFPGESYAKPSWWS